LYVRMKGTLHAARLGAGPCLRRLSTTPPGAVADACVPYRAVKLRACDARC
jgi:hypothetical protein